MKRDVVVTGLGVLGSSGIGREALAGTLAEGRAPSAPMDRTAGLHRADLPGTAGLFPDVSLATWVPPALARRMCRPSRFAVAAARLAVEDAGLDAGAMEGPSCGVVVGTAFGPTLFTEKLLREILADPETASPFLFTECVANAPTAEIALALGAKGTNWTITQREAGPVLALGRAAAEVDEGRAHTVVAGAVEEITPLLHGVLDRFRALARPRPNGERARPFAADRDGFVAAEAATALVVEEEAAAVARGARPLARVVARGSALRPPTASRSRRLRSRPAAGPRARSRSAGSTR